MADTEAVQSFLEHDLFVPLEQIGRLHNEEATRDGIIQAWFSLLNDQGIHENDPILVYYSGHGGSSDAPEGWSVERSAEKIQCLIPHDYGVKQPDGEPQQPITDRAVGHLIDMLAAKKGDNIVSELVLKHWTSVLSVLRLSSSTAVTRPLARERTRPILPFSSVLSKWSLFLPTSTMASIFECRSLHLNPNTRPYGRTFC